MKTIFYLVVGFVGVVALFVLWCFWSVVRGGLRRDERLRAELEPIKKRLSGQEEITPSDLAALGRRPELRYPLFTLLQQHQRGDLFPSTFLSAEKEAEAALAYWLMHPHELQDRPEQMELVEERALAIGGKEGRMFVFRYRMPEGHWAAKDGWLFGVSGPVFDSDERYAKLVGAFSRSGDREGTITPGELTDWYMEMLRKKGMLAA